MAKIEGRAQYFFVRKAMPIRYGSAMELRQLRYFVAVASELNFTRAAASLRVAQPALSRQIRTLEEELGVQLLERSARGVELTSAGKVFLGEASAVVERTRQAVVNTRKSSRPELNLGYIWGLFHSTVPPLMKRLRQDAPELAINLFDMTATEQARGLSAGKIHAGFIGFAHEADAAGLDKEQVGVCQFVAALPRQHPLSRCRELRLADLAQEFFAIVSEESYPGARQIILQACQSAGFRPRILQNVARGFTVLGLVAGGCGVALLPETLTALPHAGVTFRKVRPAPTAEVYLAWKRGADGAMLNLLRKAIRLPPAQLNLNHGPRKLSSKSFSNNRPSARKVFFRNEGSGGIQRVTPDEREHCP